MQDIMYDDDLRLTYFRIYRLRAEGVPPTAFVHISVLPHSRLFTADTIFQRLREKDQDRSCPWMIRRGFELRLSPCMSND